MNPDLFSDLAVRVDQNCPLADFTTFRLGGPCPWLIHCQTPDQLTGVIRRLIDQRLEFVLIGGGSNLVVSDDGLKCAVIRYHSDQPHIERRGQDLIVSGSTWLDTLALYAAENGLSGLNCASGIPGTVGGAIVGNAGAFGRQVSDTLHSVTVLTRDGRMLERPAQELKFTYRDSALKTSGDIVVNARFTLGTGESLDLLKERNETLALRWEKHPDLNTHPCAGSFFRNIEPTSKAQRRQAAGYFLELAGAKDLRVGGALVFEKHANMIVKGHGGTSQDVYQLSRKMAELVKQKFGLDLIREVRFVGNFAQAGRHKDIIW